MYVTEWWILQVIPEHVQPEQLIFGIASCWKLNKDENSCCVPSAGCTVSATEWCNQCTKEKDSSLITPLSHSGCFMVLFVCCSSLQSCQDNDRRGDCYTSREAREFWQGSQSSQNKEEEKLLSCASKVIPGKTKYYVWSSVEDTHLCLNQLTVQKKDQRPSIQSPLRLWSTECLSVMLHSAAGGVGQFVEEVLFEWFTV